MHAHGFESHTDSHIPTTKPIPNDLHS